MLLNGGVLSCLSGQCGDSCLVSTLALLLHPPVAPHTHAHLLGECIALFVLYFTTCLILQALCLRIQDIISLAKTCCTAAAELHRAGFAHRDFRLSNVVMTRRDEGSYTVIDMEHAERAGQKWPLKLLQDWDENTLDKVTTQNSLVLQSVE